MSFRGFYNSLGDRGFGAGVGTSIPMDSRLQLLVNTSGSNPASLNQNYKETSPGQIRFLAKNALDMLVEWGDGTSDLINGGPDVVHTYPSTNADYIISISGQRISFNNFTGYKIKDILSWGTSNIHSIDGLCDLVNWNQTGGQTLPAQITATNAPIFNKLSAMTECGASYLFYGQPNFNTDISHWNMANVRFAESMLRDTSSFNCGQAAGVAHSLMNRTATSGWRTNLMDFMDNMFRDATAWNGDISEWCVNDIPVSPTGFDTGATAWTLPNSRPVWGTCPIP